MSEIITHLLLDCPLMRSIYATNVRGDCLDNSPVESFFGLLKQVKFHEEIYRSFNELKIKIDQYIDYYNNKRIKQKLNWLSPIQFREAAQRAV